MTTFKLTRRTEADLLNIGDYTLDRWGKEQTVRYLAQMEAGCQRLADQPFLGRACDRIRPGLHCMEVGGHILFYRPASEFVLIVRILHKSMLPARHSMEGDA
jgi:toxin ParE1/3/4